MAMYAVSTHPASSTRSRCCSAVTSELIGGCNTFLPPGYRIDVSSDPQDSVIIIITPLGVINQPTDGSEGRLIPNSNFIQPPPFSNGSAATQNLRNLILDTSSQRPIIPHASTPNIPFARVQQPQPVYGFHDMPPPGSYSPAGLRVGAHTPNDAAVSILGNLSGRNPLENNRANGGGQTGEFNHAIQYIYLNERQHLIFDVSWLEDNSHATSPISGVVLRPILWLTSSPSRPQIGSLHEGPSQNHVHCTIVRDFDQLLRRRRRSAMDHQQHREHLCSWTEEWILLPVLHDFRTSVDPVRRCRSRSPVCCRFNVRLFLLLMSNSL